MTAVELVDLTKSFAGVPAVDQLSLSVASGELLVLVGASGCGKSTTLRLIAGLETPDQGSIRFDDEVVTALPARKRSVAMVFQDYALYPHMSVRQNLAFGLKMRGLAAAEIAQRIAHTASSLSLESLLDRRPGELSGGQQQRVAVGRAIVREPAVFLLDEPLSNLDAPLRDQLRVELVRLHQRLKTTMIYVTHDQTEAMMMGQRVAVMERGRILQVDSPMNLYRHPANRSVASLIGSPSMNFVPAVRQDGHWKTAAHRWPSNPHPSASAIEIGLRPADFKRQATQPDDIALSMTVRVVQPLGATALLQCDWQTHSLSVLHEIENVPQVNQQITCYVSPKNLYYFGERSGGGE